MIDNYYIDCRVIAGEIGDWFESFNVDKMTVMFTTDEDDVVEMPVEYIVCDLCRGKGYHVNPSIDCNGISGDEFYEDPEFYEDYRSGVYDMPCNQCKGERVVPWPIKDEDIKKVENWYKEEWEYQAMCAAERRIGA